MHPDGDLSQVSNMETVVDRKEQLSARAPAPPITEHISKRLLEPVERLSEILFGLIMVLTFTCSISITEAGREEVGVMVTAAIGCNVAWGIIDAFMYLLSCFVERAHALSALRAVHQASDRASAHRIIGQAMPPLLASVMSPLELEAMRQKLDQLPAPRAHPWLTKQDWLGAVAVFLAVFLSTFPVVIPFFVIPHVVLALRVSNGVAIVALFLTGFAFGRYAMYRPLRMGVCMAIVGSALVAITILLGG